MKTNGMLKKAFAVVLSTATMVSCLVGTLSTSATSYNFTIDSTNTIKLSFDNEEKTVNGGPFKDIDDVYSTYAYAPVSHPGNYKNYISKKSVGQQNGTAIGITYSGNQNAVPAYNGTVNYGKDSLGSMMLGYQKADVSAKKPARFRIWNYLSSNSDLFQANGNPNQYIKGGNKIKVTNGTKCTLYRVSFDYKMNADDGVTGSLWFSSGQSSNIGSDITLYNFEDVKKPNEWRAVTTKLEDVANTNDEWKHSGYT